MRATSPPSASSLSLSLVLIAIFISMREKLRLERDMIVAVVRSLVQLLIVALGLGIIVKPSTPLFWSWLWVAGDRPVRRRDGHAPRAPQLPGVFGIALTANAATAIVGLGLTFGLGIFPVEGRTVVPVAGMVIGNSMKSCVVVVQMLASLIADRRADIEARLALGLTGSDAARPIVRQALRVAINPQIENTKALGIVFLPGAMTGLILAGVKPLDAVFVQLALMYIILGAVVVTTAVTALIGTRRLLHGRPAADRAGPLDPGRVSALRDGGAAATTSTRWPAGVWTCVRGAPQYSARGAASWPAARSARDRRLVRRRRPPRRGPPARSPDRPRTARGSAGRRARPTASARRQGLGRARPRRSPAAPRTPPRRRRRSARTSSATCWTSSPSAPRFSASIVCCVAERRASGSSPLSR